MTGNFFRMPLGYGPFPGPRQTASGGPISGWNQVRAKTCTVVFRADLEQLESFLPHKCFRIEHTQDNDTLGEASISFTSLERLPWLAGRGYNHCGLYIHNVICEGKEETVRGKYLSVLFEDIADAITSGREELGYPKLFASLNEDKSEQTGNWNLEIGWGGTRFGEVKLSGLKLEVSTRNPEGFEARDLLCFKYIPRTGSAGIADVEYPTLSPIPTSSAIKLEERFIASDASISFQALPFEDLPTLHHVAAKLAGIEIRKIMGARVDIVKGAPDFKNQRAILI